MDFFEPYQGPEGVTESTTPGFGALVGAQFDDARVNRNVGGEGEAYARAYAEVNRRVKQGYGIDLPNPMNDWDRFDPATGRADRRRVPERWDDAQRALRDWHSAKLQELAKQQPDVFQRLELDKDIETRTTELMQSARRETQRLAGLTGGASNLAAGLLAGVAAAPFDPVQFATLPFGGAGRTVLQRLGSAAAVGAATEAASYPLTTAQKERAGYETGLADFATDVAVGAVAGGAFQGAGEAVAAGVRAMRGRGAQPAPDTIPDPVAARGATMTARADDAMLAARPTAILEADHALALAETQRYLEEPGRPAPIMPEPVREAAPVIPKALDDAAGTTFTYLDKPVQRVQLDPREVNFNPERFQYKGGGDTRGVTDRMAGIERWDNMAAEAIIAYQYRSGRIEVGDGHQRTGLAQRLLNEGRETSIDLGAYLFREADGWTPDQVFAVATRRNLQQGTGDVTDTAVALQRLPGILDKSVLDPDLLGMVRAKALTQEAGMAIGYKLSDPAQQRAAVDAITRLGLKGEDTISAFIDEMKASQTRTDVAFDLFGDQEIARTLAVEMAELKVKVADLLKQNAKAFKRVNEAADMLESRENVIARNMNARVASSSGEASAFVSSLSVDPGPMRDMLMAGARRVAAGEKIGKVARDVSNQIAGVAEREGMAGLVPRGPATAQGIAAIMPKLDEPVGPAAKQQADALEQSLFPTIEPAAPEAKPAAPKPAPVAAAAVEPVAFPAIIKSKEFKDAVAAYDAANPNRPWSNPHRESDVAREFADGFNAAKAGLAPDVTKAPDFDARPGTFNPTNPYAQGYTFGATGDLLDMRMTENAAWREAFRRVPGADQGDIIDGRTAATASRSRDEVKNALDRLDAEDTLLTSCVK
jgi:hypothetical protein